MLADVVERCLRHLLVARHELRCLAKALQPVSSEASAKSLGDKTCRLGVLTATFDDGGNVPFDTSAPSLDCGRLI
eukprot:6208916-Pleurochrysis_carterae.AAC.10